MAGYHEFLNPLYTPTTLDLAGVRRSILDALKAELPRFRGTVLDIGSGYSPYKSLLLSNPSRATRYIGLDLKDNLYQRPDLQWDGRQLPLLTGSIDAAVATEVFEHLPDVERVMAECVRVLKPGGLLFFTVPFLWPLHTVPYDEYRYTPFSLERHLRNAGFVDIHIKASGGWDASLAQMIGLWVRRRPMSARKRALLSRIALPLVRYLSRSDKPVQAFHESLMLTGLWGTARKPEQ